MSAGGRHLSTFGWRARRAATTRTRLRPVAEQPPPRRELRSRGQLDATNARRADQSIIIVAIVTLLVALGLLLWALADVVLLVFGGILLAVFLRSLGDALSRFLGIPGGWGLAIVLAVLVTTLVLGGLFIGAEAARQLGQLLPRLHQAWEGVLEYLYRYEWGQALLRGDGLRDAATPRPDLVGRIAGIFSTTLGALASIVIVVFIGLYLSVAPHMYRNGLLRLIPPRNRERAGDVIDAVGTTLRWWLVGTFVKMVIVGVFITTGLLLLDIPLALALGLLAFALEFVPYVGPILASVPALLVALSVGPADALYVLLLYLGVQMTEGYIIAPLIDQRSVHLPPAVAITTQVLLGVSLGVLGAVFAAPLAATALVLVNMLYVQDWLGDSPAVPVSGPGPPR